MVFAYSARATAVFTLDVAYKAGVRVGGGVRNGNAFMDFKPFWREETRMKYDRELDVDFLAGIKPGLLVGIWVRMSLTR